jgi:methyltransferase
VIWSIALLGFVTLQRAAELVLAERNTRRLLRRGAREYGAGHYSLVVALHGVWLAGLWLLAWNRPILWGWLVVFAVLQVCRVWVIATLGERWTTRIIVPPGEPRIRRGPYRLLAHPNYAVVGAEILVLPLVFQLALYGGVFCVLNIAVLWIRIRSEERALRDT